MRTNWLSSFMGLACRSACRVALCAAFLWQKIQEGLGRSDPCTGVHSTFKVLIALAAILRVEQLYTVSSCTLNTKRDRATLTPRRPQSTGTDTAREKYRYAHRQPMQTCKKPASQMASNRQPRRQSETWLWQVSTDLRFGAVAVLGSAVGNVKGFRVECSAAEVGVIRCRFTQLLGRMNATAATAHPHRWCNSNRTVSQERL